MPFNGAVTFHDITLTVPERFVRDSVRSAEDTWIFEHGNYSECIILSRKDVTGDTESALTDYVTYMQENGAESKLISFLNRDGVHSAYDKDGVFCQEILFIHNGAFYAVALRGGTESGFAEITDTVRLASPTDETA